MTLMPGSCSAEAIAALLGDLDVGSIDGSPTADGPRPMLDDARGWRQRTFLDIKSPTPRDRA
jgi:hypothetical protein